MHLMRKIEISFSVAIMVHLGLLVNTLMYPSQVDPATLPNSIYTRSHAIPMDTQQEIPSPKNIPSYRGWITIEGTVIDYPVVQAKNNDYYLEYTFDGKKSKSGALFFDYRNLCQFYDNHTVIYGHFMLDGTMFHDLHYYKDKTFFLEHPTITVKGLRETKQYTIFSVHIVSAYTYYLRLGLEDALIPEYAAHFKRLSMHETDIEIPNAPRLLTLATCTHEFENARLLIHAFEQ